MSGKASRAGKQPVSPAAVGDIPAATEGAPVGTSAVSAAASAQSAVTAAVDAAPAAIAEAARATAPDVASSIEGLKTVFATIGRVDGLAEQIERMAQEIAVFQDQVGEKLLRAKAEIDTALRDWALAATEGLAPVEPSEPARLHPVLSEVLHDNVTYRPDHEPAPLSEATFAQLKRSGAVEGDWEDGEPVEAD